MSPSARRKIHRGIKRSAGARSESNSQRNADASAHSFIAGHYSGPILTPNFDTNFAPRVNFAPR